jgi:hypothetical protein
MLDTQIFNSAARPFWKKLLSFPKFDDEMIEIATFVVPLSCAPSLVTVRYTDRLTHDFPLLIFD